MQDKLTDFQWLCYHHYYGINKTPAKAFTPPSEKKIGTNVNALPIDCSGVVKSRPLLPYRVAI